MAKQIKVDSQIQKCKIGISTGKMLVIDPSVGSFSSMPGYALFDQGKLVDSGILEIPKSRPLHRRLQKIYNTLQQDFDPVDILVIEDIQFTNPNALRAQSSLFKAIGVFLGCTKYEHLVEISPSTWKAFLRRNEDKFPDYEKDDEWDAIVMGYAVLDRLKDKDDG